MPESNRIRLASRLSRVSPSKTFAVAALASELRARGVDVIDFGPGEPDFGTPLAIRVAAKRAIDAGYTRYTNVPGCDELRDAIVRKYADKYGLALTKRNVVAGTGGKQELFNVAFCILDPGDEVVIPAPYWVSFPDQVVLAGGEPVFVQTTIEDRFRPTAALIESGFSSRTRAVILNSPCNPSGAVVQEAELRKIVELCASRGALLIYDETYEFFVYDGQRHASVMSWFDEYPSSMVAIGSLSKSFAMTGWRLGYAVGHPDLIAAMSNLQSHSTSNPSSISQMAGVAALQGDPADVRTMYEAYVERRKWLVPALNEIPGLECAVPDGAFYVFPRVKSLFGKRGIRDSQDVATYLLEAAAVAVVPGSAFGQDDYVRLSYATSLESIKEGVRRMREAIEALG
ncbi:MAG: pyridoxal phosphate-dependent aminotransferase [Acidobacteria bacterium]|nr:pyridoxal phosphate-dependent aminotransferase [Acidobacteriota bacterium]